MLKIFFKEENVSAFLEVDFEHMGDLVYVLVCFVLFVFFSRINCSQACGPFVNYNTSWEVLPTTVSQLPYGVKTFLFALSSEAFAVSFFVITWYLFVRNLHIYGDWFKWELLLLIEMLTKSAIS